MAILPVIADLDYVGFVFRVPYTSHWGHRGMTHSIVFSLVLAALALVMLDRKRPARENLARSVLYFLAAISHPLLDACTNGGLGEPFLAAILSENRKKAFMFPIR